VAVVELVVVQTVVLVALVEEIEEMVVVLLELVLLDKEIMVEQPLRVLGKELLGVVEKEQSVVQEVVEHQEVNKVELVE
jgi:hypothetical protein